MRATITKKIIENAKMTAVEFRTEFGMCRASWVGKEPGLEHTYEIELDIPYTLQWGKDILPCQEETFQVAIHKNTVSLRGILNSLEKDLCFLKLGGSIILIEAEGVSFMEERFVNILAENIVAYDTTM